MTPVIRRLQNTLFNQSLKMENFNSSNLSFSDHIKTLGPEFYSKIIPSHLILNIEYSLLGQQIRSRFESQKPINKKRIIEQLLSALLLAELLEHIYDQYLIVPREALRLRTQKKIYRDLLKQIQTIELHDQEPNEKKSQSLSFSQRVREETFHMNLYRLLFLRSKRAFDLIAELNLASDKYSALINSVNNYINPVLRYLGWVFFLPRFSVNVFLLLKHTIPGLWMPQKEESIAPLIRFQAHLSRRWFELGNDLAMITVGLAHCFILTGSLAPIAIYLAIAFFGFDVILSFARTYNELNRLYQLRKEYQEMATQEMDALNKEEIEEQIKAINTQIHFEMFRLGSHTITTTGIFFAMFCMAPILALSPTALLVSASILICIALINFVLTAMINHFRPKDMVNPPLGGLTKLGFFSKKSDPSLELVSKDKDEVFRPTS